MTIRGNYQIISQVSKGVINLSLHFNKFLNYVRIIGGMTLQVSCKIIKVFILGYFAVLCLPPKGWETYCFSPGIRLSVRLSVCHESCPLCNLKTPEAIFTKLHTNINQH